MEDCQPNKLKYNKENFPAKRGHYQKYSNAKWDFEDVVEEALSLQKTRKDFLNYTATKYGVSERTLSRKINKFKKGEDVITDLRGKHTASFTVEQERTLANKIKNDYIDKGKPFDNTFLEILAEKEWQLLYPDDNSFKASRGWCVDFKKRWNFITVRVKKI